MPRHHHPVLGDFVFRILRSGKLCFMSARPKRSCYYSARLPLCALVCMYLEMEPLHLQYAWSLYAFVHTYEAHTVF